MSFDEIVDEIMDRLNLTSSEAETRVGRLVNRYHRRITASIGVATVSKRLFDIGSDTEIGSAEVEFPGMEQVTRVWYLSGSDKVFLEPKSIDELRDENDIDGDTPSQYAVKTLGATTVIILLNRVAETEYTVYADGYGVSANLQDDDEPSFPESYHDVLVEGVLKDEYKKGEKLDLAKDARLEYEGLLSDLRMWGAKQAYLKLRQGQRSPRNRHPLGNS